jgi:uncharacterized membrane protein YcaP (DUF421 family)
MIMSVLMMRSIRFRTVLCGRPSIIIERGHLKVCELSRNRLTIDELLEELRGKGFPNLDAVQYAILETNGKLSVIPKAAEQPVTASQMGMDPIESGLPLILISDGRLISHNLRQRGLEEHWLQKQLSAYGANRIDQVFLLTVDETGKTFFVPKGAES